MNISKFNLSDDGQFLDIEIQDSSEDVSLFLFTEDTYKNYDLATDLSDLVVGFTVIDGITFNGLDQIQLYPADLGIQYFDGIYYLEATDVDNISLASLAILTKYEECILDKVLAINTCDDCLKEQSIPLLNAQATLEGIKIALNQGFIQESVNLINNLKKYCSNSCKTCGEYDNVIDNTYLSYNDQ